MGLQCCSPTKQLGDFVIAKQTPEFTPAYQLAVVVDDWDSGVTEVIRGDDLLASTFRQVAVLDAMGWARPSYCHVPLIVGPDGRRLAKRHGDTRLSYFRKQGITPEAIVGYLAWSLKIIPEPSAMIAKQLLSKFRDGVRWHLLPQEPTVFDLRKDMTVLKNLS